MTKIYFWQSLDSEYKYLQEKVERNALEIVPRDKIQSETNDTNETSDNNSVTQKKFRCKICNNRFQMFPELQCHMKKQHPEQVKCFDEFKNNYELEQCIVYQHKRQKIHK